MRHDGLIEYVQGDDLEYVQNFINTSNKGRSNNFIGYEVIIDLILSLRDTNERLKEKENADCK